MAPIPRYGQLLGEFLTSLEGYTSELVKGEDNERRNHSNTLAAINARLQGIKRDQETLQTASTLLQVQEATFERLKASVHNATQPISRLPEEVVSGVLELVIPIRYNPRSFDPTRNEDAPWKLRVYNSTLRSLTATCSRFRPILLNSPRCWTCVECTVTRGGTTLEFLAMMLARSRNCPFHLHLRLPEESFQPSSYGFQAYSQVLGPHLHRCETLYVVSTTRQTDITQFVPPNSLGALRHVIFDWGHDKTEDTEQLDLDSKAKAVLFSLVGTTSLPLLSLTIKGSRHIRQKLQGDLSSVPTQMLTRLQINMRCSMQEIVCVLRCSPNLEHLFLVITDLDEDGPNANGRTVINPNPLSLQKLVSLRVSSVGNSPHRVVLNAPRLEQVDVSRSHWLLPFDITHRTHPLLPSLTRVALEIDTYELAPFFQSHPGITECFILEGQRDEPDENRKQSMHLCAALESFLVHKPNTVASKLQHLSLKFDVWDYFVAVEPQITASMELVLHMYPQLQLDLHVAIPRTAEKTPAISKSKHSARVSINPPHERRSLWRSAWTKEGL